MSSEENFSAKKQFSFINGVCVGGGGHGCIFGFHFEDDGALCSVHIQIPLTGYVYRSSVANSKLE